jgi:hypothetical protein
MKHSEHTPIDFVLVKRSAFARRILGFGSFHFGSHISTHIPDILTFSLFEFITPYLIIRIQES